MCQQPRVLCQTLGRGRRFYYSVCKQENTIYTYENENDPPRPADPMFPFNIIDETIDILLNQFQENPFPLANSADGVPAGEADEGLGTAYHQASNRGAPETSKLAAILEDLDVLTRTAPPAGSRGLHFRINAQNMHNGVFSIRDVI